jgi:hypothetical protein
VIPAPDKSVTEIVKKTLSEDVVRSTNRYWTELTLAMVAGHYFGIRYGYWKLLAIGATGVGMNIFLKIINRNLERQK